jgi:Domain of unknown function (DUF4124)
MLVRILMTLVLAGLTAVAGAETIYKWMDSSGQVHYTDLPPRQVDAKLLGVFDRQVNELSDEEGDAYGEGSDENEPADEGDDTTAPPPAPAEPPVSAEATAAAAADAERTRVQFCKMAQDRYKTYTEARRLFKEENGKRVYLTDAELSVERARAKQSVDEYCS